jgi:hypothetical protein
MLAVLCHFCKKKTSVPYIPSFVSLFLFTDSVPGFLCAMDTPVHKKKSWGFYGRESNVDMSFYIYLFSYAHYFIFFLFI